MTVGVWVEHRDPPASVSTCASPRLRHDGGYRLYEADIRIALAWAYLASHNPTAARQEATRAQTLSLDMGYHWGQVDAAELLAQL